MRLSLLRLGRLLLPCALIFSFAHNAQAENSSATPASTGDSPLSPAQVALFDTPHLSNVPHPETLRYAYQQIGPGEFHDKILVHVKEISWNGTKNLSFDYLTGPHHVPYPDISDFRGNPLLMLVLEQDVLDMNKALGLSQAFLRNRIRDAFFNAATVSDTTVNVDGKPAIGRVITIKPFAGQERLDRIPSMQSKTYSFTMCESVPGMIEAIAIDTPADIALNAPAFARKISFDGVEP